MFSLFFRNRNGASAPRCRPRLEALEDRIVPNAPPVTQEVFQGLEFMTTGNAIFTVTNNVVTSTGPVQVGVNPAKGDEDELAVSGNFDAARALAGRNCRDRLHLICIDNRDGVAFFI